eukprot:m.322279 g.322279  ORF g.322279 m.322279 type:complete len:69 (+) comp26676_c0_seq1:1664-1870(+)
MSHRPPRVTSRFPITATWATCTTLLCACDASAVFLSFLGGERAFWRLFFLFFRFEEGASACSLVSFPD